MSGLADRASLVAYRAGWHAVRGMPPGAAYGLFERLADAGYARDTTDVRRLRANYARVHPHAEPAALEEMVRAGMRSYLRYWCEAFRLPELSPEQIVAAVREVGTGPARAELAAGRSVVCFLGHLGNWDLAGAWSSIRFGPVTTVAERLRPEELYVQFLDFRERLGMRVLPLTGGAPPFPLLRETVRAGGAVVPLLADRDLTAQGVGVTFCGRPARMAVGPAALSLATGAALFPVSVRYEPAPRAELPGGYRSVVTFHDRVEDPGEGMSRQRAEAMTQRCADVLGDVVRSHTYDWHMMQRVFTDDAPSELPAASRVDRGRRGTRGRQGSREGRGIRECRGTREGRGTRGDA